MQTGSHTHSLRRLAAAVVIAAGASIGLLSIAPGAYADSGSVAHSPSGHSGAPHKSETQQRGTFPNQVMPTPGHNNHRSGHK